MRTSVAILGGMALLLGVVPVGADVYGPGDHWVDTVTVGTYDMNIDGEFTVTIPGIGPLVFPVTGQMAVWHGDAQDTPDPLDPGHLNYVDTELVSMSMTGTIPTVGTFVLTGGDGVANGLDDGPLYTAGGITELVGDPAWAESFFDIFFEVELDSTIFGNVTVFNKEPLHVESLIDRIPPVGFEYVYAGGLNVYDNADPDGEPVAQIPAASFTPEPSSLAVLCVGALGLLARRRRRKRK